MMAIASSWYSNLNIWTLAITSLLSLLGIATSAWVTWRARLPKYRIDFQLGTVEGVSSTSFPGLTNPHSVEIHISNTGVADVTAAMFHGDLPIAITTPGARIAHLQGCLTSSQHHRAPDARLRSGRIVIPPSHLPKHQKVTCVVITEGRPEKLISQTSLVDVDIRMRTAEQLRRERAGTITAFAVWGVVIALVIAVAYPAQKERLNDPNRGTCPIVAGVSLC